jgi:hypothetical protein
MLVEPNSRDPDFDILRRQSLLDSFPDFVIVNALAR